MTREDWNDIFENCMSICLHFSGLVISWLLFTWSTLLFLVVYVNNYKDLGIALGVGLVIAPVVCWVVAITVTVTIEVYDIIIKKGN